MVSTIWIDGDGKVISQRRKRSVKRVLSDLEIMMIVNLRCIKLCLSDTKSYLFLNQDDLGPAQQETLQRLSEVHTGVETVQVNVSSNLRRIYPDLETILRKMQKKSTAMPTGEVKGTFVSKTIPVDHLYRPKFSKWSQFTVALDAWKQNDGERGMTLFNALSDADILNRSYIVRETRESGSVIDFVGGGHDIFESEERQKIRGQPMANIPDRNLAGWMLAELDRFFDSGKPELKACSGLIFSRGRPERRDWYRLCLPLRSSLAGRPRTAIALTLPQATLQSAA